MAICIPGPLVTAISGDVGGATFAQTRHGQIVRKRAVKLKKQTSATAIRRARFQSFHRQWDDLSDTKRLSWNAAAKHYSTTNTFGTKRTLSGFLLFMRVCLDMPLDSPTAPIDVPFLQAYPAFDSMTLDFTVNGPFNITLPEYLPPGDTKGKIQGYRPVSSRTLTYVDAWRSLGYFWTDDLAHDWHAPFLAVLGEPLVDEVVYIRARQYNWDRPISLPIWAPTTIHA